MDSFDASFVEVDRLFCEGNPEEGLRAAIDACHHGGPEPEAPNLRDARSDMLAKVMMYRIHAGAGDELLDTPESGMLDRRIYGWLYSAGTEIKLFPSSAGEGYDRGYDEDEPLSLANYIRKLGGGSSKHVAWLRRADKALSAETSARFLNISDPYRVGARVLAEGLKKAAEFNGQKATVTRKQGQRYGVIFDQGLHCKAVRAANLRPLALVTRTHPQQLPTLDPVAEEVRAVALLNQAIAPLMMGDYPRRPDIVHRVQAVLHGCKLQAMECGGPSAVDGPGMAALKPLLRQRRCSGDGTVDFLAMARRGDPTTFREWVISGLCLKCQDRIFGQ